MVSRREHVSVQVSVRLSQKVAILNRARRFIARLVIADDDSVLTGLSESRTLLDPVDLNLTPKNLIFQACDLSQPVMIETNLFCLPQVDTKK